MAERLKEIKDNEQSLLKRLNIEQTSKAPKVVISEKERQLYLSERSEMFQLWQKALRVKESGEQCVQICVKHKFKLQKVFDMWKAKSISPTYLFSDLDEASCRLWLKKWDVQYYHSK